MLGMPRERKKPGKVGENKSEIVREVPLACADEKAAVAFLEKRRWGDNPCCPRCGSVEVYTVKDSKTGERNKDNRWRCRDCKKFYTVRTGTVMEDSRIPLRHWCFAFWAACASKKGVSALQIQRQTGLSYKSALFLMHRIRFAMSDPNPPKLRGEVEVDETYIGGKPRYPVGHPKRPKYSMKTPVIAAVKRGGGVRAQVPVGVTSERVRDFLSETIQYGSVLHTDGLPLYRLHCPEGMVHLQVQHQAEKPEYVRDEGWTKAHTNTVECFFGLLKRKLHGTHHAVSKRHLHRYVSEAAWIFSTRYLDDGARTEKAIRDAEGKRLLYREPTEIEAA